MLITSSANSGTGLGAELLDGLGAELFDGLGAELLDGFLQLVHTNSKGSRNNVDTRIFFELTFQCT